MTSKAKAKRSKLSQVTVAIVNTHLLGAVIQLRHAMTEIGNRRMKERLGLILDATEAARRAVASL